MVKLEKNDKVAVIAPAGYVDPEKLRKGMEVLKGWSLSLHPGRFLFSRSGYFAGRDAERLYDLQEALDDPEITMVICARGGYGLSRIIDKVDLDRFVAHPKPVLGFSDITLLHALLHRAGSPSIHGIMAAQLAAEPYRESADLLKTLLFEGSVSYPLDQWESLPREGMITGGSLSMVVDTLGTSLQADMKGKVVFLEETGEGIYKVDRMLTHLYRSGILDGARGVLFGHFTEMSDTNPSFGMKREELFEDFGRRTGIPVDWGFPAGHEAPNFPLVFHTPYRVTDTAAGKPQITFQL